MPERVRNYLYSGLPWERIYSTWTECSVKHVVESVTPTCTGPYKMSVTLKLHELAAEILVEYTRASDVREFMRNSKHSLRVIHSAALGLSGVLRWEIGVPGILIEDKARGGAVM